MRPFRRVNFWKLGRPVPLPLADVPPHVKRMRYIDTQQYSHAVSVTAVKTQKHEAVL